MIQLYQSMQSVCSGKVRLVLEEKGAAYEEIDIDLQKGEQFEPEYKKLNPKAVVPTTIHDGKIIRESTLIMEYLDAVFPEPPLLPHDPYLKFRARLFPKLMDEETHAAVNLVTYAVATRHVRAANYTPAELEAHFAQTSDPERARRQRLVHEEGPAANVFAWGIQTMNKMLDALDAALEEFGGPWLMGEGYSLADVSVTNYVFRLEALAFEAMWTQSRPRVTEWWERIKARSNYIGVTSRRLEPGAIASRRKYCADAWPYVEAALAGEGA
jgi:glutathione S-transferase